MIQTKFLSLLDTIDKSSLKPFEEHLKSKFGITHQPFLLFFYVKKYYPNLSHKQLNMERAYQAVYGENLSGKTATKQQRKLILNIFNELYLALKEYLALEYLRNNPLEYERIYSRALKEHGAKSKFKKQLNVHEKALNKIQKPDIWHHFRVLENKHLRYFQNFTPKNTTKENSLLDTIAELDKFYLILKLRYLVEIESRRQIINQKIPATRLTNHELKILKAYRNETDHLKGYSLAYRLLKTKQTKYFNELLNFISLSNKTRIPDFDLRILFTYLANFSAEKIRKGKKEYTEKSFELTKISLRKGWLITEDTFSPFKFLNVVSTGCLLKDFEWLDNFLVKYSIHLDPKDKEPIINLSKAYIAFAKANYSEATTLVYEIPRKDVIINLRCRMLNLQCYIMTEERRDFVTSNWNSFSQFLRTNNDLAPPLKIAGIRTLDVIQKILFKASMSARQLKNQIKNEKLLFSRDWLIQLVDLVKAGAIKLE